MTKRWLQSRKITHQIVVTGTLVLKTPAHFGNGEVDELTDMPISRDIQDGCPLLTGASIAGAARSYLREWELGYGISPNSIAGEPRPDGPRAGREWELGYGISPNRELESPLTRQLFGESFGKKSVESYLTLDDAQGWTGTPMEKTMPATELREGVSIDPETRTAVAEQLFDMEVIEAGTNFELRFELALPEGHEDLVEGLAVALYGFEVGEIGLGARKRRGFGECQVVNWSVQDYDLTTGSGLIAWLEREPGIEIEGNTVIEKLQKLLKKFCVTTLMPPDMRQRFVMDAGFSLRGSSLLIRSAGDDGQAPDMIQLHSLRSGRAEPILPGTSLAGALRSRGLSIANIVASDRAENLINNLFGAQIEKGKNGGGSSLVNVRETELLGTYPRVQSRVLIDRFTSGSYPTGLFTQRPEFGGGNSCVRVWVELRIPHGSRQDKTDSLIGLLLHLLKDLWTSDLPLGGEPSVGRGRLKGLQADLIYQETHQTRQWAIRQANGKLEISGDSKADLDTFAEAVGG